MHWWCQIHRDNKGMWCTHHPKVCIMTKRATEQGKRKPNGPPAGGQNNKHQNFKPRISGPKPKLVSNNMTFSNMENKEERSDECCMEYAGYVNNNNCSNSDDHSYMDTSNDVSQN